MQALNRDAAPKAPWGNWAGETVCCIASGPSLTVQQCEYTHGKCRVIAVNNNYQRAPWCDAIYAADRAWWKRHHEQIPQESERFAPDEWVADYIGAHLLKIKHRPGLEKRSGIINSGLNSGFQAVNLAYHMGAKRILLIGYDFQFTGGKSHWHGDHPRGLNNPQGISSWVKYWGPMSEDLRNEGVEVINCTIETALTQFPRAPIESVL